MLEHCACLIRLDLMEVGGLGHSLRFRTESDTLCILSSCEHTLNCELLAWRWRKRGEEVVIGLVVMLRHSNCHLLWQIKYP